MSTAKIPEATLDPTHTVLLHYDIHPSHKAAFDELAATFFGRLAALPDDGVDVADLISPVTYFCGTVSRLDGLSPADFSRVRLIEDLCVGIGVEENTVDIGEVPRNVRGVGVYFPRVFPDDEIFNELLSAHRFGNLTESNKPGVGFRKGVYLSPTEEKEGSVHFHLLRCSTNLDGPTEAFTNLDRSIVNTVNRLACETLSNPARANHVLAQLYENSTGRRSDGDGGTLKDVRQSKARIKRHSDKTKDMPDNAFIAFCSFYSPDAQDKAAKMGPDRSSEVFTKLRFRLKDGAVDVHGENAEKFDVVLQPNSVFLIPLSTNRRYTHEICPSALPVEKIPVRLGYVVRCSSAPAVFRNGRTYLLTGVTEEALLPPTPEQIQQLKAAYFAENTTFEKVWYPAMNFSLNQGDYMMPVL